MFDAVVFNNMMCSQLYMLAGAYAFNQPSLYCDWKDKMIVPIDLSKLCVEGSYCGSVNDDCSNVTATPTASPTKHTKATPSPTAASTANGGGGKSAVICFLNCHYGALLILLNYYIIFDIH